MPSDLRIGRFSDTHIGHNKYKTYGKNRSLRLKDFDYSQPYAMYHVTFNTYKRARYFKCGSISRMVINNIKIYAKLFRYRLIAFCVMPDHIHLLIQAEESAGDLRDMVRDLKKFTTYQSKQFGVREKLWQRGYYEHVVREHKEISNTTNYILNNPVKKGLVDSYDGYEFCGLVDPPI